MIPGAGIQSYRVPGTVFRLISSFHPNEGNTPRVYQSYFYDPELSTQHQMHAMPGDTAFVVSPHLIRQQNEMLRQTNPYLQSFLAVHEMVDQGLINSQKVHMAIHTDKHPSLAHRGLYNGPNPNFELAIIMPGMVEEPTSRMVVLQHRNSNKENLELRVMNETHPSYYPLQYVILAPHGTDGWHLGVLDGTDILPLPLFTSETSPILSCMADGCSSSTLLTFGQGLSPRVSNGTPATRTSFGRTCIVALWTQYLRVMVTRQEGMSFSLRHWRTSPHDGPVSRSDGNCS